MGWIWQEKRRSRMEQKSIREQKREARAEARARLAGCTPEDTARWGEAMFEYLRVLPVWNTARTVMCFVSTPSEPDTRPLLQAALRQVLGDHVHQAGSLVEPDRLRFDFTHFEAPTPEQLREIENLANKKILENAPVKWREMPFREIPKNALAFFGEKYGAVVRLVEMGDFSKELCGGAHVSATGEIGLIKIVSESAISSGTRRIEAVAGTAALKKIDAMQDSLSHAARELSCKQEEIADRIEKLISSRDEIEKKLRDFLRQNAGNAARELAAKKIIAKGSVPIVTAVVEAENPQLMRELAVKIAKEIGGGVVALGAKFGEKATVMALCGSDAVEAGFKAGDIVRQIASQIGGKGGGKPDFAQGGGKPENLDNAIADFANSIK